MDFIFLRTNLNFLRITNKKNLLFHTVMMTANKYRKYQHMPTDLSVSSLQFGFTNAEDNDFAPASVRLLFSLRFSSRR